MSDPQRFCLEHVRLLAPGSSLKCHWSRTAFLEKLSEYGRVMIEKLEGRHGNIKGLEVLAGSCQALVLSSVHGGLNIAGVKPIDFENAKVKKRWEKEYKQITEQLGPIHEGEWSDQS